MTIDHTLAGFLLVVEERILNMTLPNSPVHVCVISHWDVSPQFVV